MSFEKENQILLDTLEEFAGTGGWFINLLNMEFSALGNKIYDIYGIPRGIKVGYQQFLYEYVVLEDQLYIEQIRMRLIGGETPISFSFRIISKTPAKSKNSHLDFTESRMKMKT